MKRSEKDARRIYMKLDEFRSRRPIDIIAKTNPVLIIDEPQSVLGTNVNNATRAGLLELAQNGTVVLQELSHCLPFVLTLLTLNLYLDRLALLLQMLLGLSSFSFDKSSSKNLLNSSSEISLLNLFGLGV